MLFHEYNEIVPVIPPMDATHCHYSTFVDVSHWHHATIICSVGQAQNAFTFALRKGIKPSIEDVNRKNEGSNVTSLPIARFWSNKNTDATATTHLTAHGRPSHDSTINSMAIMAGPGHGSHDLGSRGQIYVIEVDNTQLGKDSNGNAYDCIQVVARAAYGPPPCPSGIGLTKNVISVFAILSEPRYAGKACTEAQGRVRTRDW